MLQPCDLQNTNDIKTTNNKWLHILHLPVLSWDVLRNLLYTASTLPAGSQNITFQYIQNCSNKFKLDISPHDHVIVTASSTDQINILNFQKRKPTNTTSTRCFKLNQWQNWHNGITPGVPSTHQLNTLFYSRLQYDHVGVLSSMP